MLKDIPTLLRYPQIEGIEEDLMMEYVFTASLWIGYCALHSYLISIRFTNLMSRLLRSYYAFYRLFYILVSLVLLIPLIKYTGQADTRIIITYGFPLSIVRYALIAGSLTMFFYAFFFNYDSLSFLEFVKFLISERQRPRIHRRILERMVYWESSDIRCTWL